MLDSNKLQQQGLFQPEYVARLIKEHETAVESHHKELWTLLVFQLWYANFLDHRPA
jgi:asparagine synthase (glutamine-hydrolysing)